jgi:hypothetical protein
MLRIACWRLTFETLHLLKLFGLRGPKVHYFAYGGNLDPAVLKARGITATGAIPACANNYVLRFNHDVPFIGVGMASIETQSGSSVHGMLYSISKVDEWVLDCLEGHLIFKRYRKGKLELSGKRCFFYYSGRTNENLLPSKAYLQKLANGYRILLGSDSPVVAALEKHPFVLEMIPRNPPYFLFSHYGKWGRLLRPFLEAYDRACVKVYVFFIFRPSLFGPKR